MEPVCYTFATNTTIVSLYLNIACSFNHSLKCEDLGTSRLAAEKFSLAF